MFLNLLCIIKLQVKEQPAAHPRLVHMLINPKPKRGPLLNKTTFVWIKIEERTKLM